MLNERGVSTEGQFSKGLDEISMEQMDVVVTMGCEVDCPLPGDFKGRRVDWEIPDPFTKGPEFFRSVRDLIEERVRVLLEELHSSQPESSS